MSYLDNLLKSLNMLNPSTDEEGNPLQSKQDVQSMSDRLEAKRLGNPVIQGELAPAPIVPEIEPVSGAPLLNNSVLSKLRSMQPSEEPIRMPASEAPVEQFKASNKPKVQAPNVPTQDGDSLPVAASVMPSSQEMYASDLSDQALKEAMAQRDRNLSNAYLSRAASQFAMAGAGGTKAPDFSTAEMLEKQAGLPIEDVLTRRKGMEQELDRKVKLNEAEKNDPNSEISRSGREFAKNLGLDVSDKVSYSNLEKLMENARLKKQMEESVAARKEAAAESRAFRKELQDQRLGDKKEQDSKRIAERYLDRTRKTPEYKTSAEILASVDSVRTLAKDANFYGGQSLAMLGPKIAKGIAGEVGVLTEQDVTRYVQDPSVAGKLRDTLTKMKSGKLSDASYENIMRLVDIMEKKAAEKQNEALAKGASLLSRNEKLEYTKARELLDPSYVASEDPMEQKIKAFMQKNSIDSRDKAIKILRDNNKLPKNYY